MRSASASGIMTATGPSGTQSVTVRETLQTVASRQRRTGHLLHRYLVGFGSAELLRHFEPVRQGWSDLYMAVRSAGYGNVHRQHVVDRLCGPQQQRAGGYHQCRRHPAGLCQSAAQRRPVERAGPVSIPGRDHLYGDDHRACRYGEHQRRRGAVRSNVFTPGAGGQFFGRFHRRRDAGHR